MSSYKAWDIYAKQLSPKGYGYPLLYPEHPNEQGYVPAQIGDVGLIIEGKFTPFFNVVNRDSPLNIVDETKTPQPDFVQLKYPPEMMDRSNIRISGVVSNEEDRMVNIEGGGNVGVCVDWSSTTFRSS